MMAVPEALSRLRLPVVAAPMFLVSGTDLVIAQCRAGIVGSFPARNAREPGELRDWIKRIRGDGGDHVFAVNLIAHRSNDTFERDAGVCLEERVPLLITSMAPHGDLVREAHRYGGLVFHDVTTVRHARKAAEQGVDGLILVCAGAGGHGGMLSPFALLPEVRRFFHGPLLLGGAITSGRAIRAAQVLGADLCYLGTPFIATRESAAPDAYKQMVTESAAGDITYTPYFSGVPANYLTKSITAAGLDPAELRAAPHGEYRQRHEVKAWRDIWGAGQGVGAIDEVRSAGDVINELVADYQATMQ